MSFTVTFYICKRLEKLQNFMKFTKFPFNFNTSFSLRSNAVHSWKTSNQLIKCFPLRPATKVSTDNLVRRKEFFFRCRPEATICWRCQRETQHHTAYTGVSFPQLQHSYFMSSWYKNNKDIHSEGHTKFKVKVFTTMNHLCSIIRQNNWWRS